MKNLIRLFEDLPNICIFKDKTALGVKNSFKIRQPTPHGVSIKIFVIFFTEVMVSDVRHSVIFVFCYDDVYDGGVQHR